MNKNQRFGAHMGTSGGLHNALTAGRDVGCDVVQIFTKSPQQWKAKEITEDQISAFLRAQEETGVPCVASHDSYLINPAAADPELLQKSRNALVDELVRSSRLRIPYVVMHQGACGDASEEESLGRLAETVRYVLDRAPEDGSVLLLETTAGQGTCLGDHLEHLAYVFNEVDAGDRLAVCLDTCHMFAAGYDLRDAESYAATMEQVERLIGFHRIKLIHANDSVKGLGSHVDRHAHIGQGELGLEAFRLLLTDPRLAEVPVVLETPKKDEMDPVNLAALRAAAGVA